MRKGYVLSSVFLHLFSRIQTCKPNPGVTTERREMVDISFGRYFEKLLHYEAQVLMFDLVGTGGGPEVGRKLYLLQYR